MTALTRHVEESRKLLTLLEADEAGPYLLVTALQWQKAMHHGPSLLSEVVEIIKHIEMVPDDPDPSTVHQHVRAVGVAIAKFLQTADPMYREFAQGRDSLYTVAKIWGIPTKRPSAKSTSKPLAGLSYAQLVSEIRSGIAELQKGVGEMVELGTLTANKMQAAANAHLASEIGVDPKARKALVDTGLNFRDAVSAHVFRRSNSVLRRTREWAHREMAELASEAEMQEARRRKKNRKPNKPRMEALGRPAWADDPEIGMGEE
jgi:hypothetical protein